MHHPRHRASSSAGRPLARRLAALVGVVALAGALAVSPAPEAQAAPTVAVVSTWTALAAAFTAGGTVQLAADITAPSGDGLAASNTPVTLDLNGHALSITAPGTNRAAVQVSYGAVGQTFVPQSLTIEDTSAGGTGTLTATGGNSSAGIGGDWLGAALIDAGTIIITGGTVNATGGQAAGTNGGGAGIGGALEGYGGNVTISGGTVTAVAGVQAAGIGSGNEAYGPSSGGTVTISGGTVNATGHKGAGIGGGARLGGSGGTGAAVTISGGTVTATGLGGGAGIGGGASSYCNDPDGGAGGSVTITGGTVTAAAPNGGAAIGGGLGCLNGGVGGAGADVQIGAGATVTATAAGITGAIGGGAAGSSGTPGAFGSLTNAGSLTIPAGNSLIVPSGATATNSGTIHLAGTLAGTGTVDNSGTIAVASGGSVAGNGAGPAGTALAVTEHNYALTFDPGAGGTVTPTTMHLYAASLADAGLSLSSLVVTPPTGKTLSGWAIGSSAVTDTTDLSTILATGPSSGTVTAQYQTPGLYAYPSGAATAPTACPAVTTAAAGCSLAQALSLATSGGTVLLATDPGTGTSAHFTTSTGWSLATGGVTIRPDTGVAATLDGQNTAVSVLSYTGAGTLTVTGITVKGSSGSQDSSTPGGGIVNANTGTLTVTDSTFTGNNASGSSYPGGYGGGIVNYSGGAVLVSNSTFSDNDTSDYGQGGGITNVAGGSVSVDNSTFADNVSSGPVRGGGGGVRAGGGGAVTVTRSTFVGNVGPYSAAGGIDAIGATPVLSANLFASDGAACVAAAGTAFTDAGYNISNDGSCGFSAVGSVSNSADLADTLNPLGNYGGPTQTVPPEPGSPAVGMIPSGTTVTVNGANVTLCPTTDQRGIASSGACNAGSIQDSETSPPGAPTGLSATAGITTLALSWTAPANTGGSPITGYNVYELDMPNGTIAQGIRIGTVSGTSFLATGLTPGVTNFYAVTAVNAAGESAPSAQLGVSTLSPMPTSVTLTASGNTWPAGTVSVSAAVAPLPPPPGTPNPTGTVTLSLYGPAATPTCTAATRIYTASVSMASAVTSGGAWTINSGDVTVPSAGSYYWIASYSGDTSYLPVASQCGDAGSISTVAKGSQKITVTSTAPTGATVGGSYPVTATGGASGEPIVFSVDTATTAGACTIAGATVSFTGAGRCVIDANQDGDGNWDAAPQVQQAVTVIPATATLTVSNTWVVDGASYASGSQPAGLSSQLTVGGADTGWDTSVTEAAPSTVAIGERTTIDPAMVGCTVTSQQITELDGAAVDHDISTAAYDLALAAGSATTVTVTNTVTCTTRLTLAAAVVGSADPQDWTLTAYTTPPVADLGTAAFSGTTGTSAATGDVTAATPYQLGEAVDPGHTDANGAQPADYVQDDTRTAGQRAASPLATGSWTCTALDGSGNPLAGSTFMAGADGLVAIPLGYHVGCTATNRTAQVTLLDTVVNDDGGTLAPSAWDLTADPTDTTSGLAAKTVTGAAAIGAANTVEVHPGAAYAVSERTADGSTNAYLLTHVQQYTGPDAGDVGAITAADLADPANWTDVADPGAFAAPAADGHAVLRLVIDDIAPLTLPHTGGAGTLAYLGGGGLLAILAGLGAALVSLRRRRLG